MKEVFWNSAWIVGGSTGLGAVISKQLSQSGVHLFISARNDVPLKSVCSKLDNAEPIQLDVTDLDACISAVDLIQSKHGAMPDLIILNAAVYTPAKKFIYDPKDIRDMINVNYMGVVNMISAIMSKKTDHCKLTLAVVSSPSGWRGLPGGGGYGASKAAVINFIESIKPELEQVGVDLRLINPGFIRTRLTDKNEFDMPQLMSADYAAKRALGGLKKGSFDTAFPNPFILVLKILRLLPYSLYFWLMRYKR